MDDLKNSAYDESVVLQQVYKDELRHHALPFFVKERNTLLFL